MIILSIAGIVSACAVSDTADPSSRSDTSSDYFGLPGKGDQSCDRKSVLCWSDAETKAVQDLMDSEAQYLLEEITWRELDQKLESISYKLTSKQNSNKSTM